VRVVFLKKCGGVKARAFCVGTPSGRAMIVVLAAGSTEGPTRRARELDLCSLKPVEPRVEGRRDADVQLALVT